MSKLDYVTIAIVAICFAAIIFLVVKIAQLMNRDQPELEPNRIEETLGEQASPATADDTYDATTGEAAGAEPDAAGPETRDLAGEDTYEPPTEARRFEEERAAPTTKAAPPDNTATREEELTARGEAPLAEQNYRTSASTGEYMVLAGSFRYKHNAEAMVRKLKRLGYDDAHIGYFNKGTYAVAVVGQYAERSQASSTVKTLEGKHKIEARIQKN